MARWQEVFKYEAQKCRVHVVISMDADVDSDDSQRFRGTVFVRPTNTEADIAIINVYRESRETAARAVMIQLFRTADHMLFLARGVERDLYPEDKEDARDVGFVRNLQEGE